MNVKWILFECILKLDDVTLKPRAIEKFAL